MRGLCELEGQKEKQTDNPSKRQANKLVSDKDKQRGKREKTHTAAVVQAENERSMTDEDR